MKTLIKSLSSLLILLCLLSSCEKRVKYDIKDINDVSSHIVGFALSSKDNAELERYEFSIENKENQGLISNSRYLPYKTELGQIKFKIDLIDKSAKVLIAWDKQAPLQWEEDKTYDLPNEVRELRITVLNAFNESFSYSYLLQINQYDKDPETISWERLDVADIDYLKSSGSAYILSNPQDKKVYLLERGGEKYYSLPEDLKPVEVNLSGLMPNQIEQAIAHRQYIYALSNSHKVYCLNGTQWEELPIGATVYRLLGAVPDASRASAVHRLALIVEGEQGELRFAFFEAGKLEQGRKLEGLNIPGRNAQDYLFTSYEVADYSGGNLKLLGLVSGDDGATSHRSVWFTDKATNWANEKTEELKTPLPTSMSLVRLAGLHYIFETGEQGLSVHYAKDGLNWTKSKDLAAENLPQDKLKSAKALVWVRDGMFYLLSRSKDGELSLWRGTPQKQFL